MKETATKTVKIKGRNGIFWLKNFKVVVGKTRTAVYFFSARRGQQAPSAITGETKDIIAMLDEIKVEIVRQSITETKTMNPSIGTKGR
jgi:hypothetical protein